MQCLAGAGERSREIPPIPKKYQIEFNGLVERSLGRAAWTAFSRFLGSFVAHASAIILGVHIRHPVRLRSFFLLPLRTRCKRRCAPKFVVRYRTSGAG